MKKLFTVVAAFMLTAAAFAQAPQKMSYQTVIRDGSNTLVSSTSVGIQISVLQGSASGTAVYVETHNPTTNANGLASLEIGNGTVVSGDFSTIDWSAGPYFIKTETDPTGGTSYTIVGTSQLMSVPYALFAANGTPGPVGPVGPTGANGIDGINGVDGVNGTNGIDGATGATGATGANGIDGATGTTGATGPQGLAGIVGATGANGTNGTNGTNGVTGATGATGAQGLVGPTGAGAGATYRWATFCTYEQNYGWAMGNDANMFGGINPSNWTDGGYQASQMSSDKEVLRTLYTQKGYAKKNAMIFSEEWYSYSSTNGKVVTALFRINNTTASAITWTPVFYYSAYASWGEYASVALNGVSMMYAGAPGMATLPLSIPPNRVSTVIFVSTSSAPTGTRNCRLGFYNNSLDLPAGLQFIDDLDTATGGWEQ